MPFHRVETFASTVSGVSATSSEVADMQTARVTFETARSIEELRDLTVGFLRGDLKATAYHLGSVAPPPVFVEGLVTLNHMGFLTTGCQVGGMENYKGAPATKRFYVEGCIPRRYLALFTRALYMRFGAACFMVTLEGDRTYEEIQDLKRADLYAVTRVGNQELQHIPDVSGPCQMFQTCDEVYPELVEEYMSVFVLGTEWGATGANILEGMCEALGTLIRTGPMSKCL